MLDILDGYLRENATPELRHALEEARDRRQLGLDDELFPS